jgi:hypothetical protein
MERVIALGVTPGVDATNLNQNDEVLSPRTIQFDHDQVSQPRYSCKPVLVLLLLLVYLYLPLSLLCWLWLAS